MFYENAISSSLIPNITRSTRLRDTTSTLIDNIFSNPVNKNCSSGNCFDPFPIIKYILVSAAHTTLSWEVGSHKEKKVTKSLHIDKKGAQFFYLLWGSGDRLLLRHACGHGCYALFIPSGVLGRSTTVTTLSSPASSSSSRLLRQAHLSLDLSKKIL